MKIDTFKASFVNRDKIQSLEQFTRNAKLNMKDYENNNIVEKYDQNVILVYEIKLKKRSYSGIIAMTEHEDYNKLLGHEKTLTFKEEELLKIATEFKTMLKPVLLAYNSNKEIDLFIQKTKLHTPFKKIYGDDINECHTFWIINDIDYIKNLFSNIERAYIADGHHRYSLHLSYKENKNLKLSCLLSFFVSFDQIDIKSFNRGLFISEQETDFINQIGKYCEILKLDKIQKPTSKSYFTIICKDHYYQAKWKNQYINMLSFDIELFNEYILYNIFKIENHRNNQNIRYYEGDKSPGDLKKISEKENEIIFIFFPVDKNDLIKNSNEKKYLPPKSTWFMPRVKSGIITCKL